MLNLAARQLARGLSGYQLPSPLLSQASSLGFRHWDKMSATFLDLVAKRLASTSEDVRVKREELNSLDIQIKAEVERMGKKHSMSYEAAEAKIAELEYNHAHSSLSNAE